MYSINFGFTNLEVRHTHICYNACQGLSDKAYGVCGPNESLAKSQELYEVPEVKSRAG